VNTENKQEPSNSEIMTKLVNIEKEIKKSEKSIKSSISWTVALVLIGFMLGFAGVFNGC